MAVLFLGMTAPVMRSPPILGMGWCADLASIPPSPCQINWLKCRLELGNGQKDLGPRPPAWTCITPVIVQDHVFAGYCSIYSSCLSHLKLWLLLGEAF